MLNHCIWQFRLRIVVGLLAGSVVFASAYVPAQSSADGAGPFEIVRSFPVNEPTWAMRSGDLYLVAAKRSILVFKKNGPEPTDYEEVAVLYPAHDTYIDNFHIEEGLLYFGAKEGGYLVYRLADLAHDNPKPIRQYNPEEFLGWSSLTDKRIYTVIKGGGVMVLDRQTLKPLGLGLTDTALNSIVATPDGYLYATGVTKNRETQSPYRLFVIDARNPRDIRLVSEIYDDANPVLYGAPAVVGTTLYVPEYNGGVGIYDCTDPAQPRLVNRYGEAGGPIIGPGGRHTPDRPGRIKSIATDGRVAYVNYERTVDALEVRDGGLAKLGPVHVSQLSGGGLMDPQNVILNEQTLAVTTTMEGARFYDVSDPAQPKLLLNIDLPSRMEGMAKVGRFLYITADEDGVWQIDWDGDTAVPRMRRRIPLEGLAEDLVLHANHLYVAAGTELNVIDVNDPDNPREVHAWPFPYPNNTPAIPDGWIVGVAEADGYLYVALGAAGVAVFDLANPARPRHLATLLGNYHTHDVDILPGTKLLAGSGNSGLSLFDVSDPAAPRLLSRTVLEGPSPGLTFSPDGRHLIAGLVKGITVFDVADPADPKALKTYPLKGMNEMCLFYKGYLLVAAKQPGLEIYKIGATPADLEHVQHIPAYWYTSKFWLEDDRIFVNCQGIHELRLKDAQTANNISAR